jgi:hypothetical protein
LPQNLGFLLTLTRQQRGGSEIYSKARAPDGDMFILAQVGVGRDVVILVAFVAFHRAHVDEASSFDRIAALLNGPLAD